MIHEFATDLAFSEEQANSDWWFDFYRRAFPTLQSMSLVKKDGWAQRGGVDRVLILESGKTLYVDEKVRRESYDDVALEYWSNKERRHRGWIAKDAACDYIAYIWLPKRAGLMLPFHLLRQAYYENRQDWFKRYPSRDSKNNGYVTTSLCVPTDTLLDAMRGAISMRVET